MELTVPASFHGQGLVEYALIVLLVAGVVILTLGALGVRLGDFYNSFVSAFPG